MRVRGLSLSVLLCVALISCGRGTDLPPASTIPPGQSWKDRAPGFSTIKMIELCGAATAAATNGNMRSFSDAQIANGTCEMSLLAVELIGRSETDETCQAATIEMMREFKR